MAVKDISHDLDRLNSQLDKLEAVLQPLTENLSDHASQLALLDRAKLFTLVNYSIESLLFSSLKLQGANALQHPLYTTELKRVKQYFAKIEKAENPVGPRKNMSVNKEAAARILKADLSGDKTLSEKLAEKIALERAKVFLNSMSASKRPADEEAETSSNSEPKAKKSKRDRSQKQDLSSRPKRK